MIRGIITPAIFILMLLIACGGSSSTSTTSPSPTSSASPTPAVTPTPSPVVTAAPSATAQQASYLLVTFPDVGAVSIPFSVPVTLIPSGQVRLSGYGPSS